MPKSRGLPTVRTELYTRTHYYSVQTLLTSLHFLRPHASANLRPLLPFISSQPISKYEILTPYHCSTLRARRHRPTGHTSHRRPLVSATISPRNDQRTPLPPRPNRKQPPTQPHNRPTKPSLRHSKRNPRLPQGRSRHQSSRRRSTCCPCRCRLNVRWYHEFV